MAEFALPPRSMGTGRPRWGGRGRQKDRGLRMQRRRKGLTKAWQWRAPWKPYDDPFYIDGIQWMKYIIIETHHSFIYEDWNGCSEENTSPLHSSKLSFKITWEIR